MATFPSSGGVTASCPHCGASNAFDAAFCEECGKAMPGSSRGPRVVEGAGFATTSGGQKLQSDELQKKAKSAAGALLAVAILATLGVGLVFFLVKDVLNDPEVGGIAKTMLVSQVIMALAYWGLWVWSRTNPLPAAIVGLVVYLSVMAVNAIAFGPETLVQGIIIKIIIIVALVKAIQAGVQHRDLQRRAARRGTI